MTARERGKKHPRLDRTARRECLLATEDAMIYGSGFILVDKLGECSRVKLQDVIIDTGEEE